MVDHFFLFFITSYIKTVKSKKTFITLLCATTRLTDQEKKQIKPRVSVYTPV